MKKYYKDYTPDSKVLKNGKVKRDVVYHGDYYCYGDSLESFKWLTKTLVGQTLLFSILFIALGFLNSPGSRSFTVLIPYFCSFLPAAYMWTALTGMYMLLRNSAAGKKKRYDRKNGICKISSFILQNKKMRSRNDDYDAYCCNWQSYINNYAFQYGGINARNSIFYRRISYVGRCIYHNDSN